MAFPVACFHAQTSRSARPAAILQVAATMSDSTPSSKPWLLQALFAEADAAGFCWTLPLKKLDSALLSHLAYAMPYLLFGQSFGSCSSSQHVIHVVCGLALFQGHDLDRIKSARTFALLPIPAQTAVFVKGIEAKMSKMPSFTPHQLQTLEANYLKPANTTHH